MRGTDITPSESPSVSGQEESETLGLEFEDERFEEEDEFEFGPDDEVELEAENEGEFDADDESEFGSDDEDANPLAEEEAMELAAELLSVSDEAELDLFLGKLVGRIGRGIRKVGRRVRGFARSKLGRRLGGAFKGIAKRALPFVGSALGSVVPGVGTAVGGALGSAASRLFEAELEGLGPEEQEFEKARRFVDLCGLAGKNAVSLADRMEPGAAVRAGLAKAVQEAASAVSEETAGPRRRRGRRTRGRTGRWVRRGGRIVVLGV